MKNIIIIFALILMIPLVSSPQENIFSTLTEKYSDQEGFSATMISHDMFDLYLKKKDVDKDSPIFETLDNLDNILIVSQSNFGKKDSETNIGLKTIHDEILEHYKSNNFHLFKTEKRMGEDVKIYLVKEDDGIKSLALVTSNSTSTNLVELNGLLELKNISELSKALNLRGLENLYKIDDKSTRFGYFTPSISPNFQIMQENIKNAYAEQKQLSEEQLRQFREQGLIMKEREAALAEKYREMAERYGRKPIFLSYPGDSTTVYYINGEKAKAKEIKNLDKDKIKTIDVSKNEKKDRNEIRIITK